MTNILLKSLGLIILLYVSINYVYPIYIKGMTYFIDYASQFPSGQKFCSIDEKKYWPNLYPNAEAVEYYALYSIISFILSFILAIIMILLIISLIGYIGRNYERWTIISDKYLERLYNYLNRRNL